MKTRDFYFDLPDELIAQEPPTERGSSRLLVLNRADNSISHFSVKDLTDLIPSGTVMLFNNSRVRKARLFGTAEESGGRVEFLFLQSNSQGEWQALVSKAKKQLPGKRFLFPGGVKGHISRSDGKLRWVAFDSPPSEEWFDSYGHVPLPPYIKRPDAASDAGRYQTVYSDPIGSAAAPTAGLHFTEELMASLRSRGIQTGYVTLHVGLGTFLPIRSENILDHKMHLEHYTIPPETAELVNQARGEGRPILAVGTTVVRCMESAWRDGSVQAGEGSTDIFIYPGYKFKAIDTLFTNFHTPESTLLLLVSAFCGKEFMDKAYREAVNQRYRFFSYGDAMLIL